MRGKLKITTQVLMQVRGEGEAQNTKNSWNYRYIYTLSEDSVYLISYMKIGLMFI